MMIDGRTDFPEVGQVYRLVTRGMGGAVTSTPMIRVSARWMNKDGSRHISYMDMAEQQNADTCVQLAGNGWYRLFTPIDVHDGVRLIDVPE